MSNQDISNKLVQMDQELRFLWQEANEEPEKFLKERKLKQYWELFKGASFCSFPSLINSD